MKTLKYSLLSSEFGFERRQISFFAFAPVRSAALNAATSAQVSGTMVMARPPCETM